MGMAEVIKWDDFDRDEGIAISGTRFLAPHHTRSICDVIRQRIIKSKIKFMLFGGACGVDDIALKASYQYREHSRSFYPRLVVVVPDQVIDQPFDAREGIRKLSDSTIELGNRITEDDNFESYRIRNRWMIDHVGQL